MHSGNASMHLLAQKKWSVLITVAKDVKCTVAFRKDRPIQTMSDFAMWIIQTL